MTAAPGEPAPEGERAPGSRAGYQRWNGLPVVGVALAALAAGFGQFGAVAALGDVAHTFGEAATGPSLAEQAGLSGTELGVGLAVIRLASLAALPVAGAADRLGRRRVLLAALATGLALTVLAAASPGYWWFVAVYAIGRPFLSATNIVCQVNAAEQTGSADRARAVALVTAGYGVGAGATAFIHGLGPGVLGFRGVLALAGVPLAALWWIRRWVTEPDRFTAVAPGERPALPVLSAVEPRFRPRLRVVVAVAVAVSLLTGPANSFVFLYAENVVRLSRAATAAMVVGAGVGGLAGLVLGRWLADRLGRRPAAAAGMVGLAGFGVLAYSGSRPALVAGYVLGVLAGATLAPALSALVNELFPTSVRASAAGWWAAAGEVGSVAGLLAFGALADVGDRFSFSAAVIFAPLALAAGLFWLVPETRGREPEELWPTGG